MSGGIVRARDDSCNNAPDPQRDPVPVAPGGRRPGDQPGRAHGLVAAIPRVERGPVNPQLPQRTAHRQIRALHKPDDRVYPGFPTLFWGLSGFFVNDLMGKALWSSWKTRSVFQGAVGAFCASTAPSASTGPICMRQDRRVLGLQSTRE